MPDSVTPSTKPASVDSFEETLKWAQECPQGTPGFNGQGNSSSQTTTNKSIFWNFKFVIIIVIIIFIIILIWLIWSYTASSEKSTTIQQMNSPENQTTILCSEQSNSSTAPANLNLPEPALLASYFEDDPGGDYEYLVEPVC